MESGMCSLKNEVGLAASHQPLTRWIIPWTWDLAVRNRKGKKQFKNLLRAPSKDLFLTFQNWITVFCLIIPIHVDFQFFKWDGKLSDISSFLIILWTKRQITLWPLPPKIILYHIKVHGMMKNLASNCLGGLAFWAFGWALSMGRSSYSTAFFGYQLKP